MNSIVEEHLGVAVVDDDRTYRELTCALLSAKTPFMPFPVASGEGLFDLLSRQKIDCIVLDYNMGDDTGLSIKSRLDQQRTDAPPIIMLTGDGRESTAIKAFRMGVNDYLPKSNLQAKALVSTIVNVVSHERQRLLAQAEHRRLAESAEIDLVSGLPGRTHLDSRLAQLAALDQEARRSYALIMVEMLQYQAITEQAGLKVSDQALRAFSKTLKLNTRSGDIACRYEKGKFIIISDVKGDPEVLDVLCKRLAQDMRLSCETESAKLELSGSVMGAICEPRADDGAETPPFRSLIESITPSRSPGAFHAMFTPGPSDERKDGPDDPAKSSGLPRPAVRPAAEQLRVTDRRNQSRHRVFKRGLIHMMPSGATFNCRVKNLSAQGAGLRLEAPFAVPQSFKLEIIGFSEPKPVIVRWQAGVDVGVEFTSPLQVADKGNDGNL